MNSKLIIVALTTVAMAGCASWRRSSDTADLRDNWNSDVGVMAEDGTERVADTDRLNRETFSGTSTGNIDTTTTTSKPMHSKHMGMKGAISKSARLGNEYLVLNFAPGSDVLTDASKNSLRSFIDRVQNNGKIEDLHVAVWSDRAFSFDKDAPDLSSGDRDLADRRIDVINNFLDDELNIDADIKTYSMAEKSNWFARAFRTDDAELKSLFSQQGSPANVRPGQLRLVKQHGGPMKAVILATRKIDEKMGYHHDGSHPMIGTHVHDHDHMYRDRMDRDSISGATSARDFESNEWEWRYDRGFGEKPGSFNRQPYD